MKRWVVVGAVALAATAARAWDRAPDPRAVRVTRAEVPSNAVARGRLVYERYGCVMCHGAEGQGGFANSNAETDGKVPGVIFVKEGYTGDELRRKVLDGVAAVGRADPKGPTPPFRMPGWRTHMAGREIDDLVEYLFSLYPKTAEEKWR